ncbi:NADP-dependent oxidoreductase [Chitinophaga skermanii]|nr:NADP-dependent oxidoreductase [Chitinophaga skermanii]
MKAIQLTQFGSTDNFQYTDIPVLPLKDGELRIAVKSLSINPVDAKTRTGKGAASAFDPSQLMILGWDVAGIVSEVAPGVTAFKVGDEVFGMVNFPGRGNAYAEYVIAPAAHIALKPANITYEEAAAATLAALTAWQGLVTHEKLQAGQRVLIHAAAGGVGHFAVQIAHQLGAYVAGTGSPANKDFILSLGADEYIDYTGNNLAHHKGEFDLVLDAIGGDNFLTSLDLVKPGGSIIQIPRGLPEEHIALAKERGVKAYFFMVQSNGADMQSIATWLKEGKLKPHVSKVFGFDDIVEAHQQIESGKTKGKIVINL